jgi:hypothetical protein
MRFGHLVATLGAVCVAATTAQAQAGQRFSAQASALYADLNGDAFEGLASGIGFEAQLRYNFQTRIPFSIGVGYQRTMHSLELSELGIESDIPLSGFFVEPRLVINTGSERVAPYVSARLSRLTQKLDETIFLDEIGDDVRMEIESSGMTLNAGGGLLFNLRPNLNLDVGATFGYTNFGDFETTVDGQRFPEGDTEGGSGTGFVLRAGLVFGFGGVGR